MRATHLWWMNNNILHLGLLDEDAITLDAAALELASLDHPEAELDAYTDVLAAIAERLADVGASAETATARAAMLARVIGVEFGFSGDRETYDHSDNADMIRVIDRRRGLPVSLSILYVAAARRIGWSADALDTPGHVLVRIGHETAPVLIDPFGGGAAVGQDQLTALLARMLGPEAMPASGHLAAMTNRGVLVRLLMNQATRAEASGDAARALIVYGRMTDISPATGHAWWERARLELLRGDVADARRSLSAMLEMTRDPQQRSRIRATLETLAGSER